VWLVLQLLGVRYMRSRVLLLLLLFRLVACGGLENKVEIREREGVNGLLVLQLKGMGDEVLQHCGLGVLGYGCFNIVDTFDNLQHGGFTCTFKLGLTTCIDKYKSGRIPSLVARLIDLWLVIASHKVVHDVQNRAVKFVLALKRKSQVA